MNPETVPVVIAPFPMEASASAETRRFTFPTKEPSLAPFWSWTTPDPVVLSTEALG